MKKVISLLLVVTLIGTLFLVGCSNDDGKGNGGSTTGTNGSSTGTETGSDTGTTGQTDTDTAPDPIVLRIAWWGNQTRDARTQEVLDLYTSLNPHVTFEAEPIGWDGYWDRMATQTAAGTLPDIVQHDYAFIGQYIDRGVLADLMPFVESGVLDLSNVGDSNIDGGRRGDGLYGIALGVNALAVIYNEQLLADLGYDTIDPDWTWAEYEALINEAYGSMGLYSDVPLAPDPKFLLENILLSNGKSFYSEDGSSLGFDTTDELVQMFSLVERNIASGVFPHPETVASITTMEEGYLPTGLSLTAFTWSNMFVAQQNASEFPLNLTVMPNNNNGNSGLYLKPSQFFSVTETSEHKEEAAKVIDFFTNSVEANNILLAERGIPISDVVRDGIKDSVTETVAVTFEYIALAENYAVPIDQPEPAGAAEVTSLLRDINDEIQYGVTTPEEGAERFLREANAALRMYN